jgi:hypothetical protein
MVQLGFYFHMQQVLHGSRVMLTWPLVFAMCFMLVFSIVIALFKDIPDVKGDSQVAFTSCQACADQPYCSVGAAGLECKLSNGTSILHLTNPLDRASRACTD